MSSTAMSKGFFLTAARAFSPPSTASTEYPPCSRKYFTISRMRGSSSTTRTRRGDIGASIAPGGVFSRKNGTRSGRLGRGLVRVELDDEERLHLLLQVL